MATVRLADGRRLAFTEYGRADGFPVVYLHGAIGSPLRRNDELDLATDELGLRLIFVHARRSAAGPAHRSRGRARRSGAAASRSHRADTPPGSHPHGRIR